MHIDPLHDQQTFLFFAHQSYAHCHELESIRVATGTFYGTKKIFPEFLKICPKNIYAKCNKLSFAKFSVAVGTLYFLYHHATDLKIENLALEIRFAITQLENVWYAVQEYCQKPAGSEL